MWKVLFVASWAFFSTCGSSSVEFCPIRHRCNPRLRDMVKPSCSYNCCTIKGWIHGQFPDQTPCRLRRGRRAIGVCIRGNCISWSGGGIPGRPSPIPRPPEKLPSCNEIVGVVGYATTCSYKCISSLNSVQTLRYPKGTPCLELAQGGKKPAKQAGLCDEGKCISYNDIDGEYLTVKSKVFPPNLMKCPEKAYLGRRALFECRHYCPLGESWFYGSYMGNTTCQTDDPRFLGWCCRGECHARMWCGANENSVDYPLR